MEKPTRRWLGLQDPCRSVLEHGSHLSERRCRLCWDDPVPEDPQLRGPGQPTPGNPPIRDAHHPLDETAGQPVCAVPARRLRRFRCPPTKRRLVPPHRRRIVTEVVEGIIHACTEVSAYLPVACRTGRAYKWCWQQPVLGNILDAHRMTTCTPLIWVLTATVSADIRRWCG